jgi:hypothetical protein
MKQNAQLASSPNTLGNSRQDVAGFHEGFADLVAIFQRLSYSELVKTGIRKAGGRLDQAPLLTDLIVMEAKANMPGYVLVGGATVTVGPEAWRRASRSTMRCGASSPSCAGIDAGNPRHDELMQELMRDVMHHVADEETVLLPLAEQQLDRDRLSELGAEMTRRGVELVKPRMGKIAKDQAVGFSGSTAAMVVGLASALFAVRAITRRHA